MSYGVETLGMPLSIMLALIFGGLLFLIAGSNINVKNENESNNNDGRNDRDIVVAAKTNESTSNDDDVATGVSKIPLSPPWMIVSKKQKQRNRLALARARVKESEKLKKEARGDRDQYNSNSYINDGGTGSLRGTTNIDTAHAAVASSSLSTCFFPTTSKSRSKNERAQARAYYESGY
jgi:hypothetical protein